MLVEFYSSDCIVSVKSTSTKRNNKKVASAHWFTRNIILLTNVDPIIKKILNLLFTKTLTGIKYYLSHKKQLFTIFCIRLVVWLSKEFSKIQTKQKICEAIC